MTPEDTTDRAAVLCDKSSSDYSLIPTRVPGRGPWEAGACPSSGSLAQIGANKLEEESLSLRHEPAGLLELS